ncbi:MAG TPA: methyl-accepting chemotaxis protein [Candidatus Omnitrophica bacterium]|nr:methyl-accepting chemotaxis protein [Candidatus Omnitrophota bacterium]
MNKTKNRRKKIFANKLHRNIFLLVFFASLLPATLVTFSVYYLIFNVLAEQFVFPEAIAYSIIPATEKVTNIILAATPISISLILVIAHRITHRIVGPFDRIIRELDKRIEGNTNEAITLRDNDKFLPLVERINKLLNKINTTG